MTEEQWLESCDPNAVLQFLRNSGKASDRKLRLFAVACCRHMFRGVRVNPWDEHAVNVAERYADGVAMVDELREASERTTSDWTAAFACQEAAAVEFEADTADNAAGNAAWAVGEHAEAVEDIFDNGPIFQAALAAEKATQSYLLRDIVANPFAALPRIDETWLTWNDGIIKQLAEAAYEERALPSGHLDSDRLAVLADALEEVGADAALIEHVRSPGAHVRGCWVVDLLTGRK